MTFDPLAFSYEHDPSKSAEEVTAMLGAATTELEVRLIMRVYAPDPENEEIGVIIWEIQQGP